MPFTHTSFTQDGAGATNHTLRLLIDRVNEISAALAIGAVSPTATFTDGALGATEDDYGPAGMEDASRLRLTSTGATDLSGILARTDGDTLWLTNLGSEVITLTHDDSASAAANRFSLPTAYQAGGLGLGQFDSVILVYDGTLATWLVQAFVQ